MPSGPDSGYRSDASQKQLYDAKVKELIRQGQNTEEVEKIAAIYVALPGSSPHRTGRAVDLYLGNVDKSDEIYEWLLDNAEKYGFYNYEEENWHWEYNPPAK